MSVPADMSVTGAEFRLPPQCALACVLPFPACDEKMHLMTRRLLIFVCALVLACVGYVLPAAATLSGSLAGEPASSVSGHAKLQQADNSWGAGSKQSPAPPQPAGDAAVEVPELFSSTDAVAAPVASASAYPSADPAAPRLPFLKKPQRPPRADSLPA